MFEPPGPKLASYGAEFFGQNIHGKKFMARAPMPKTFPRFRYSKYTPFSISQRIPRSYDPCAYAQNIPGFRSPKYSAFSIPPKNTPSSIPFHDSPFTALRT